jgi:hypothetical protein
MAFDANFFGAEEGEVFVEIEMPEISPEAQEPEQQQDV